MKSSGKLEKLIKYKGYNAKYIKYEKSTIRKDKSKHIEGICFQHVRRK